MRVKFGDNDSWRYQIPSSGEIPYLFTCIYIVKIQILIEPFINLNCKVYVQAFVKLFTGHMVEVSHTFIPCLIELGSQQWSNGQSYQMSAFHVDPSPAMCNYASTCREQQMSLYQLILLIDKYMVNYLALHISKYPLVLHLYSFVRIVGQVELTCSDLSIEMKWSHSIHN